MKPVDNYPEEIEAMDMIINSAKEDIPNVPEDIFVEHILPQLARRDGNVDLSFWSAIAGNVYRPINVVKDGTVLFTVPPPLRQYGSFTNLSVRESVPERLEMARLKTQVHPQLGETYYDQEFSKLAHVPPPNRDDVAAWDKILIRYGYPPLTTAVEAVEDVKSEGGSVFMGGADDFDDL